MIPKDHGSLLFIINKRNIASLIYNCFSVIRAVESEEEANKVKAMMCKKVSEYSGSENIDNNRE